MAEHILGKDEIQVRFLLGAPISAFGEMDIIPGFEPGGGSSILSGPANLAVVQWIERGPPKTQILVRFRAARPLTTKEICYIIAS